jgi:hypothetical protein
MIAQLPPKWRTLITFLTAHPELGVFLFFIVGNLFIDTYRLYLLLVVSFYVVNIFVLKDFFKATWVTFFGIFLFHKTRNFVFYFGDPQYYLDLIGESPIFTFFISFADPLFVFLVYLVLVRLRKKFQLKGTHVIDFLLLSLISVGAFASYFSPLPDVSWFWLLQSIKNIALFYIARIIFFKDRSLMKVTLMLFILFCLFNSGLILYQKYLGRPTGFVVENKLTLYGQYADESSSLYRPAGIFWDANLAATFLAVLLPFLSIFTWAKQQWIDKRIVLFFFSTTVLALIYTASRATWVISASIFILMMLWLQKRKLLQLPKINKKYVSVAVLLIFLFLSPFIIDRLKSLSFTVGERGGLIYRLHHLSMAKDLMFSQPFGVGLNVFQYLILDKYDPYFYFSDSTPPHNLLAEIGSSMGILGLLLFCALLIEVGKTGFHFLAVTSQRALSINSLLTLAIIFSLVTFVLCSQFYPWLFSPVISGIVWLFVGFFYAETSRQSTQKN